MFLDCFRDLLNCSAEFFIEVDTKNATTGQVTKTWSSVQTADVGFWVDNSNETNVNDKFVDQATGTIVADPNNLITFTPTTKHKAVIGGVDYFIIGVDNVAHQDEVYLLKYRKENV